MSNNIVYKTKSTSIGSRSGNVSLSDNPTTFKFEKPKELGGKGAEVGVNPEQLLSAAYSACYSESIDFLITKNKLSAKLEKMECEAFLISRDGGFKFAFEFRAYLSKTNENEAQTLLRDVHKVCPFSYSFGTNIDIKTNFTLI